MALEIPYTELSEQALTGVIDNFVLREGTDYGPREYTLEEKRAHVLDLLQKGFAQIRYDVDQDHIDIILSEN
ncbi:MAG: YheU family protein [Pseudomonadota bacterium]